MRKIFGKFNPPLKFSVLWAVAYIIPPLSVLWLVNNFGVNVPYWDQWEFVDLFEKVASGKAGFQDFFALHNEHRLPFPKLIIVALAFISHWNTLYELYFSVFLVVVIYFLIYKIAANTSTIRGSRFHLANIACGIVLFSFAQWEGWLIGLIMTWYLVNICLILCIFLLTLRFRSIWVKVGLGAICCVLASFSLAHGLFTWLAVIPLLVWEPHNSNRESFRFPPTKFLALGVWSLLFVLTSAIYFSGYKKPAAHPDNFFFLKYPFKAAEYFFALLGHPLLAGSNLVVLAGLLVFLVFILFLIDYLKKPNSPFSQSAAPWISLGIFTLLFALVTTVGRAGFGVSQAGASRYVTTSSLIIVALIQLWKLKSEEPSDTQNLINFFKIQGSKRFRLTVSVVSLLTVISSLNTLDAARQHHEKLTIGKNCLEVIDYVENSPNNCLQTLYPLGDAFRDRVKTLQQIGLFAPTPKLSFVENPSTPYGYVDSLPSPGSIPIVRKACLNCTNLTITGWAILPDHSEPARLVFLSYNDSQAFIADTAVNLPSPDVAKVRRSRRRHRARWAVQLSPSVLPDGNTAIAAWVYDRPRQQFVKLSSSLNIRVED